MATRTKLFVVGAKQLYYRERISSVEWWDAEERVLRDFDEWNKDFVILSLNMERKTGGNPCLTWIELRVIYKD